MDEKLNPLLEDLSNMVHEQWMAWSKGLCKEEDNISDERCKRWATFWVDYKDLPEEIKDIDRRIALQYLKVIEKHCLCL